MKNNKLVFFSDLQVHNYKQFAQGNSRLYDCLDVLDKVWEKAAEIGARFILNGGDTYDSQGSLPTVVVNATIAKFQELALKYPDIICISITGNHDQASKSLWGKPAISAISHIEKVIPKNFIKLDDTSVELPGTNLAVFGIPYYEYPEHFRLALEATVADANHPDFLGKKKLLMMHQTPSGLGNANIPVDIDVNDPLFDVFDMVIDGHIHKRQQITPKFLVIGSPIHRTLEDEGQEKGFITLNIEEPTQWELVSTRGFYPEFKQMKVRDSSEIPKDSKDYIIPNYEMTRAEQVDGDASVEEFGSNLAALDLVTNYWTEVDGKDGELLKTGLKYIN